MQCCDTGSQGIMGLGVSWRNEGAKAMLLAATRSARSGYQLGRGSKALSSSWCVHGSMHTLVYVDTHGHVACMPSSSRQDWHWHWQASEPWVERAAAAAALSGVVVGVGVGVGGGGGARPVLPAPVVAIAARRRANCH